MQLLCGATNPASTHACAHEVVSAVPPIIWFIREQMRPHRKGLSLPQFRALTLVDRQPCASLSTVADRLGASLPTTSRLITGLVAKGFVTRKGCCDDRRQLELAITPRGREILDTAWAGIQTRMETEFDHLSDAQRKTIHEAMKILQTIFGSLELPNRTNPCSESVALSPKPPREKSRVAPIVGRSKVKLARSAAK